MLEREVRQIVEKMALAVWKTNMWAERKDSTFNVIQYGKAVAYADILRDLCDTEVRFKMVNPKAKRLVRFASVSVDGKLVTVTDKPDEWFLTRNIEDAMTL